MRKLISNAMYDQGQVIDTQSIHEATDKLEEKNDHAID